MPTPIVYQSKLYVLANNGVFDAYDLHTGKQVYRQRLKHGGSGFSGGGLHEVMLHNVMFSGSSIEVPFETTVSRDDGSYTIDVTNGEVDSGDTLDYTITVMNSGRADAHPLSLHQWSELGTGEIDVELQRIADAHRAENQSLVVEDEQLGVIEALVGE